MEERHWQRGLRTGEFIHEWKGFTPSYLGCFYGSSLTLGGEEEFSHCYDFFSGIGDVEWWIVEEINKLTQEQQDRMLFLMRRNKWVYGLKQIKEVIDIFTRDIVKEEYAWHRLGSYLNYEYIRTKLTKYARFSHIKLPKIEDFTEADFNIDINSLVNKNIGIIPGNINCNPIVKLSDILQGNAFIPSDIGEVITRLELVDEGYYLEDIKKETSDKQWLDSFNITKEDIF